jgi:hypothetical protein
VWLQNIDRKEFRWKFSRINNLRDLVLLKAKGRAGAQPLPVQPSTSIIASQVKLTSGDFLFVLR